MTRVLIVGGGIAGLSTALALSELGMTIDLVERNSEVNAIGSGITLIGAGLRALERLRVLSACVTEGYMSSEFTVYSRNGETLQVGSLPSAVGSDLPGCLGMLRPTLHRILLDRAIEKGLVVRTRLSPKAIDDHIDNVSVTFSDGSTADYDLVIGADGIRSSVRELVFGPMTPVFRQQVVYRVIVPRPRSVTGEVIFAGHN